ncbi:LLM class flavin-dependent oxidoreductase [Aquirufa rosea]|uniref:Luciferase-like monooxygenase n=1 Tax=Aquirufa rosea TaxID=2509241 RepID=A0A4Q1C1C4_9BACT|nr:LLM class flavin-dependent oxidoreductase [Aquirufa rosea]RXK50963.1 LLM class flavin-dependent oxidoreductase [Aquirufa rosea]
MPAIPISVLELAPIPQGGDAALAIERTVETAQHAETLGFRRVWLAEHHNMEFIASSSPALLIGHVAGKTSRIRVGSGGIMLPNHSPLVVAEQFGTLATMYPGRIDLGLGRAPGTDQLTARVLRRDNTDTAYHFPQDVAQLQQYFSEENSLSSVRAFPAEGLEVPIWILGSSTDSAYLAAKMGLPYAFAAHFAPAQFRQAIEIYRKNFTPSDALGMPYVMACVNVVGADTDEEAEHLRSSLIRMFVGIITNQRVPLAPPGPLPEAYHIPEIKAMADKMLACSFFGSQETLQQNLGAFIEETGIDELMVATYIFDREKKKKSYTILREAIHQLSSVGFDY